MATVPDSSGPFGPFVRRADASRSARRPVLPVLSLLSVRTWLGLAVLAVGLVWMVAWSSSLAWYGFTPVGLYHTLDQPPILVTLVGLWFTLAARGARPRGARPRGARARGARARASGSESREGDS